MARESERSRTRPIRSRDPPVVVVQNASQLFTTIDFITDMGGVAPIIDRFFPQPLMIALGVIVFGVVGYRAASAYHL